MLVTQIGQLNVSFRSNWNKPIHRWYRFHAGCSSEFPEKIIDLLKVKRGATILDPFTGSGTILVVAKERGINSVGFDLNPFYAFMAGVKTYWEFDMKYLFDFLSSFLKDVTDLFGSRVHASPSISAKNIPSYICRYFDPEVLHELSVLRNMIVQTDKEEVRDLMLLALASILIDASKVHYVGETIVFDKPKRPTRVHVREVFAQKILEMYADLRTKQDSGHKGHVEVRVSDARDLRNSLQDGSIDHVITHPPYLNNYNYLLHDRLPLFFLEYLKTLSDEKHIREMIVGSVTNKKVSMDFSSGLPIVMDIAEKVRNTGDIERYEAILEYSSSMNAFFENLYSKMNEHGYCAMLVGNSYIRGVMIPLDIIIARIAEANGFELVGNCLVRDRGNGAFQHLYNGKLYESIVVLKRT